MTYGTYLSTLSTLIHPLRGFPSRPSSLGPLCCSVVPRDYTARGSPSHPRRTDMQARGLRAVAAPSVFFILQRVFHGGNGPGLHVWQNVAVGIQRDADVGVV